MTKTLTQEEWAQREREYAAAAMENLRLRGVLASPSETVPLPLEQALDLARQPDGLSYASETQLRGWAARPETMDDEAHEQFCQGGAIAQPGTLPSVPCPRCHAAAAQANLRARLITAGVDGRYLDYTWDDLEQVAPLDRLARACGKIDEIIKRGVSLLLWSEETGTGKTQAAMLAAVAAIAAGHSAHVANIARVAMEVRDGYGDKSGEALKESKALKRLTAPDLLVIDDLGAGETDSASVERRLLFLALDERVMHRRPTVITSNLSPRELSAIFGARVMARLQPLTIIHVNHKKNFRTVKGLPELW